MFVNLSYIKYIIGHRRNLLKLKAMLVIKVARWTAG